MINIKIDKKGEIDGVAMGNPLELIAELVIIILYVFDGMSNMFPKKMRKSALKEFLDAIYKSASKEIEEKDFSS